MAPGRAARRLAGIEVKHMEIAKTLQNQGDELGYECADNGDRKQVWLNKRRGMAVRIEWFKMEKVIP